MTFTLPAAQYLMRTNSSSNRGSFDTAFQTELVQFLRVVRGEIESPSTVEESKQSLLVALAADISLKEHRPVAIDSVIDCSE